MIMELQGMAQSLLATKGLLPDEDADLWSLAMVDALLVDSIQEAAKEGKSPKDFVEHLVMMVQERALEWMDGA